MLELVVATPVFLDLTFVGLESLPALGEEKFAADMIRTPGGGAITAVGAPRGSGSAPPWQRRSARTSQAISCAGRSPTRA